MAPSLLRPARSVIRAFLANEAAGGMLLIAAAALAMLVANASLGSAAWYDALTHAYLGPLSLQHWVNDGLMAVFFLVVGLEIKREWVDGRLASWRRRGLPAIAAAAGMAVPALVYFAVVRGETGLAGGWAIPAATDIAFALGVLALLGKRAPTSLKLLLTTIAIVDDMGAVVIIALFYTSGIALPALGAAALLWGAMLLLNRLGVKALWPFLLLALGLWLAVLLSGVHATIAGVLAAFAIPIRATPGAPDAADSPLHRLEHALHPWSAFVIVPVFGFVNAGVPLAGMGVQALLEPLPLGVAAGLFLGKQAGIFASIWLAVRWGIGSMPRGATWLQIYGLALLTGIGFTMSLFIGALAFPASPLLVEEAKLGILLGSLCSALVGFLVLRFAPLHADHVRIEAEQAGEIDADGDVAQ